MPVTNPVNNATTVQTAITNCAFCTLAGVVDHGDCGGWVKAFTRTYFKNGPMPDGVDELFGVYWEIVQNLRHSDIGRDTLERQVRGFRHFLTKLTPTGQDVSVDIGGSSDRPLSLSDAMTFMTNYPEGTPFAYMIGEWSSFAKQITHAHWLTARRTQTGVRFTDYQMDIDSGVRSKVARRLGIDASRLTAPHVTNGPMRPFGDDPEEGDVAVVIAYIVF